MRRRRGRPGTGHPLCRARPPTGTLIDTAPFPVPVGCVVLEDSPSPVYGAALLMRFGSDPIRGSNPRSSAERRSMLVELRSTAPRPAVPSRGGDPPDPPVSASPTKASGPALVPPDPWCRLRRLKPVGVPRSALLALPRARCSGTPVGAEGSAPHRGRTLGAGANALRVSGEWCPGWLRLGFPRRTARGGLSS